MTKNGTSCFHYTPFLLRPTFFQSKRMIFPTRCHPPRRPSCNSTFYHDENIKRYFNPWAFSLHHQQNSYEFRCCTQGQIVLSRLIRTYIEVSESSNFRSQGCNNILKRSPRFGMRFSSFCQDNQAWGRSCKPFPYEKTELWDCSHTQHNSPFLCQQTSFVPLFVCIFILRWEVDFWNKIRLSSKRYVNQIGFLISPLCFRFHFNFLVSAQGS